ncbi:hypothetical protein GWI33_012615 [Rhynchophorus ferrugineus]|uniref:Uncharacterized protein n=1 Tax=Rhynchophorus ferrugineus TaxID=354439 RepID=A0A834MCA7_RHYFE|nr:hypothetical protein GWI33_012615 [Rhynchophorus ferrugineus]
MSSAPRTAISNLQFNAGPRKMDKGVVSKRPMEVEVVLEEEISSSDDEGERLEMKKIVPMSVNDTRRVMENEQQYDSPNGSLRKPASKQIKNVVENNLSRPSTSMVSSASSPNFRRNPSIRSLKNYHHVMDNMTE